MELTALNITTLVTALACGTVGGVFFGFSTFVMPSLRALPPAQGIAAMQSINRFAPTPIFMLALFGAGLACLGLAVWSLVSLDDDRAPWLLAGSIVYFAGNPVVTMLANVPRNDALDRQDPESPAGADYWTRYAREWTSWNHVRTVTGIAGAALLTISLTV